MYPSDNCRRALTTPQSKSSLKAELHTYLQRKEINCGGEGLAVCRDFMQGLMQAEGRWHCIIMGCMGQKWVVWQSSLCSAHRCTGMWIGTLPRWPCNELKYCCWLNIDSEQSWVCFALLYLFWAHSPSLDQQVFKHKNVRALQSSWLKTQLEKLHQSSQR